MQFAHYFYHANQPTKESERKKHVNLITPLRTGNTPKSKTLINQHHKIFLKSLIINKLSTLTPLYERNIQASRSL